LNEIVDRFPIEQYPEAERPQLFDLLRGFIDSRIMLEVDNRYFATALKTV